MSYEAKRMLNKIYELCDSFEDTPLAPRKHGADIDMRKVMFMDLVKYIMYLSASDGRIGQREAEYLADLTDIKMTTSQIREFIEEQNIYSTKFESEAPLILKILVATENLLFANDADLEALASDILVKFFEIVGKELCEIDCEFSTNERSDMNIYLNTMRGYIKKELKVPTLKSAPAQNSLKARYEILKKK